MAGCGRGRADRVGIRLSQYRWGSLSKSDRESLRAKTLLGSSADARKIQICIAPITPQFHRPGELTPDEQSQLTIN